MGETVSIEEIQRVFDLGDTSGLSSGFERRRDGGLVYRGESPGPGWHRHGWCPRWLWVVVDRTLSRERVFKQRWFHPAEGKTQHSRPPEELGQVHSSAAAVVLILWLWLDGVKGLDRREDVAPSPSGYPSSRTVRRWLRRALPLSMSTQQAIRRAIIEEIEPRPFERLIPGGLSPPRSLKRRRWQNPTSVSTLWTGLTIAFKGAIALQVTPPLLLAEARGRLSQPDQPFLI